MAIQISGSTVIHDSQDVQVSGVVTATSFHGDASQLTNLPAAGSSLQATASGTLADGSTVIVNTDGTVSVAAQTGSASPSAGSPVTFESSRIDVNAVTYDSTNNRVVIAYKDYFNSFYGTAVVGTVSGTSINFGTPVVYQYANFSYPPGIAYDSTNDRVVITYMDGGNSNYATAIVGDVDPSNNSITFGTKIAYNSARSDYTRATFDSTNSKVVFTYKDTGNSNYGTARVGEINPSNNSITFGSESVFEYAGVNYVGATYDSTSGKIVVGYQDQGNSNYGTAAVGTVSGTSISFGTPVVFDYTRTEYAEPVHDSSTDRIVIAYRDANNNDRGKAVVGEVSGTSITFGTPAVFDSNTIYTPSTVYDSVNQKIVIGYSDSGNSSSGTAIIVTVSGTSISFGSPTVFTPGGSTYISGAYDSTNKRIVFSYMDDPWGSTFHGKAVVYAVNTLSTNLTGENYIGISNGAYSDGQTATIQLIGSVDDAQSGLTAGQKYYIQNNGTLSETAGDPSVLAGKAISSTKLAIKG